MKYFRHEIFVIYGISSSVHVLMAVSLSLCAGGVVQGRLEGDFPSLQLVYSSSPSGMTLFPTATLTSEFWMIPSME